MDVSEGGALSSSSPSSCSSSQESGGAAGFAFEVEVEVEVGLRAGGAERLSLFMEESRPCEGMGVTLCTLLDRSGRNSKEYLLSFERLLSPSCKKVWIDTRTENEWRFVGCGFTSPVVKQLLNWRGSSTRKAGQGGLEVYKKDVSLVTD